MKLETEDEGWGTRRGRSWERVERKEPISFPPGSAPSAPVSPPFPNRISSDELLGKSTRSVTPRNDDDTDRVDAREEGDG